MTSIKSKMNVPLFDLRRVIGSSTEKLKDVFDECLEHSNFIMGPEVSLFEKDFSDKVGAKYCLGVSSGTDALQAIFMALDLNPGDEIIVPSFTFVASASSIVRAGFKPVFADLEKDSFHPSARTIDEAWTDKTKGVLAVHLFGEPEDLYEIKAMCNDRGAFLIEDCAQSYGSTAGNTGVAAAYSFFPAKNLGCLGDGGAVTTNDDALLGKLNMIRTHGSRIKYSYELLGGNFRLDTIQAGFLRILLKESNSWICKRKDNAEYYAHMLEGIEGLILPKNRPGHSWNQYTLRIKKRDELKDFLSKSGIETAIYYPIPLHKSQNIFGSSNNLNETDKRCNEVLSIPIYPGLSGMEREYVASKIKEFFV